VKFGGVVYTSVLNPADGRKNWTDIVTAFCWAFGDKPDATLILKMVKGDSQGYRVKLFTMLAQLAPFRCRIITLDGFLEDEDYVRLVAGTTYYVNASNAEGLCLPLMEYMALGKPVIAPRHTAMEDYIDPSAAFIVRSSPEHNVWPNDPRQRFNTMRERIHWDSVVEAYRESYRVAKDDPARYDAMGRRAAEIIRDYSSDATIRAQLQTACEAVIEIAQRREAASPGAAVPDGETPESAASAASASAFPPALEPQTT
jgi:glycosyltransferase involved in cell wall biosynthesis